MPTVTVDNIAPHFLQKVSERKKNFGKQNIEEVLKVLRALNISQLNVYKDENDYAIYLLVRTDLPDILFSIPRVDDIRQFAYGLTKDELEYAKSTQNYILSYSVITAFLRPTQETQTLANELFNKTNFYQAVHNRGPLSSLLSRFVGLLTNKDRLYVAPTVESAIEWLKRKEIEVINYKNKK